MSMHVNSLQFNLSKLKYSDILFCILLIKKENITEFFLPAILGKIREKGRAMIAKSGNTMCVIRF